MSCGLALIGAQSCTSTVSYTHLDVYKRQVEGRSTKSFVDTDKAFATLTENGIDESLLYERTPLALSKIETMLGKSKFAELLTDQVVKSPGKPTIVPESDKRQPFNMTSAQHVFSNK